MITNTNTTEKKKNIFLVNIPQQYKSNMYLNKMTREVEKINELMVVRDGFIFIYANIIVLPFTFRDLQNGDGQNFLLYKKQK